MAAITQLMDFTLGFAEADRPWAEWIAWVLEAEGYTVELPQGGVAGELRPAGQHLIIVYSQRFLQSESSDWLELQERFLSSSEHRVLPIVVESCDVSAVAGAVFPVNLVDCDRTTAKQWILEVVQVQPLPFQPPPKPPFRKPQPPFPGKSQQQGWIQIRERQTAQGYIEKLGDALTLEMVQIPGGSFMMGQTEAEKAQFISVLDEEGYQNYYACELPQHSVTVPSFFMGRYPVTQAQWQFVAGLELVDRELNPDPANFKGDNRPVEQIAWHDAIEFCGRLSRYTNREYSLPSEAQWEYACRAGTTTPFHFGETIDSSIANYDGKYAYGRGHKGISRRQTTTVGLFKVANAFGLYDMHGNVWEWCFDHWHESYQGAPTDSFPWIDVGGSESTPRMLRGGSWDDFPGYCRSAARSRARADYRITDIGFRVISHAQTLS
ncbi:SUMF1/EgtB/PvdO family nonheme iron enzyme [Alkalinema sp. FACHB-956]|uniref:SUMF1/EgtB/PvdO family nonheme iron enzyme n=1 Tax=Alkalinema sp. FACHB-956 TaxID=2692768 RepID=UPI00168430F7|nr:SUMF1/EgtB/PvdO family nonheme iron enzyme [Alkalinema sp. FACHB-956]MBD2325803.1 SUMF1/EgtB/PvdO family nonheme iron enzyme [Alkalinema sp. FACHB-956]